MNDNTISPILKQKIKEERCNILSMNYEMPVFSESLFPVVAAIIESIENNNSYNKKSGILIFIPGFGEIQDLLDYLTNYFIEVNNNNMEFLILHSLISDEEQEKVFINSNKRKIILATNIAESSITISNIDFVIDFCLVKQNRFDEDQNTSLLELRWCSEASCNQRKGRTGRIRKGKYFQLITNELSNKLQKYQVPEILRSPLETPILKLKIYDEKEEPEKILMQTMSPPSQEKIINTIFRLQKMGAIINLEFGAKKEENKMIEEEKEFNEEIKNSNNVIIIKKINNFLKIKKR
jgi:ATP-dependent RNA helicase TDRD9